MKNKLRLIFSSIYTIMLWFALLLQFVISTKSYVQEGRSFLGALIQILSFFTIQSNLLVLVALTSILLFPFSSLGKFFSRAAVLTATAIYILIVGLVYAVILKGIWQPEGLFKLADTLLHEVSPLLFIAFWIFFVPKEQLPWKLLLPWAIFPLLYLCYSLIRGLFTGNYPYPFINAAKLGYTQVFVNSLGVLVVFLLLGSLLIGISRWLYQQRIGLLVRNSLD